MAFFEQLGKRISDAGQGISQSTKNKSEIAKLNGAINENKKRISGYITSIGEAYYKRHRDDPENEQPELINNLNRLYDEIARYEDRIKELRGIGRCPACGADVPSDAAFCHACGAKLPQAVPAGMAVCPSCHSAVAAGNRFCTSCGAMMPAPEKAPEAAPAPAAEPAPAPETEPIPEPEPAPEPAASPVCSACGARLDPDSKFCTQCGTRVG